MTRRQVLATAIATAIATIAQGLLSRVRPAKTPAIVMRDTVEDLVDKVKTGNGNHAMYEVEHCWSVRPSGQREWIGVRWRKHRPGQPPTAWSENLKA